MKGNYSVIIYAFPSDDCGRKNWVYLTASGIAVISIAPRVGLLYMWESEGVESKLRNWPTIVLNENTSHCPRECQENSTEGKSKVKSICNNFPWAIKKES